MFQIDSASAAVALPPQSAPGVPGFFTDGSVAGGVQPTVVTADWLNAVMLELVNVVTAGGLVPSKVATNQLLLSIENLIEARSGNYAVDTGAANVYVIALSPAITAYAPGLSVKFRAVHANTLASTLNIGLGAVPLTRDDGTPLQLGDIPANSVVCASYDPGGGGVFLINSIVASQLGAVAKENIGLGLEDDGSGNLRVKLADASLRRTPLGVQANDPIAAVSVNQAPTAANHMTSFVATAAITFTMAATSSLWNGFCLPIYAKGGAVTFIPNAADAVDGNAAGQSYTLLQGQNAEFVTDGAGNWWPFYKTIAVGSTPPKYINTAQTLGPGVYLIDTSGGAFAITLSASPALGDCLQFIDGPGTFGINNLTLNAGTNAIAGVRSTLSCDTSGHSFSVWFNGADWELI